MGQWFCAGTPISLARTEKVEANPPTSHSRGQTRCVQWPPLTWHPGAGGERIPRPAAGRAAADEQEAGRWSSRVGRGVRGRSQHRAQKTIREARCSAPVEAAGPAPARTRCRETRVGRRGSLYQSCRDITRRPGSRGSGGRALRRGRVLRLRGLGTRAAGAGPR